MTSPPCRPSAGAGITMVCPLAGGRGCGHGCGCGRGCGRGHGRGCGRGHGHVAAAVVVARVAAAVLFAVVVAVVVTVVAVAVAIVVSRPARSRGPVAAAVVMAVVVAVGRRRDRGCWEAPRPWPSSWGGCRGQRRPRRPFSSARCSARRHPRSTLERQAPSLRHQGGRRLPPPPPEFVSRPPPRAPRPRMEFSFCRRSFFFCLHSGRMQAHMNSRGRGLEPCGATVGAPTCTRGGAACGISRNLVKLPDLDFTENHCH